MVDENKIKSDLAVQIVMDYLSSQGYNPMDVTRDKSEDDCGGCDIIANINNKRCKIEVKGTTNLEGGIPDCHNTLFNEDKSVVADFFYIVRFDKNLALNRIDILSKEEIDKYKDSHKWIRRLRTTKLDVALKNKKIGKTILPVDILL